MTDVAVAIARSAVSEWRFEWVTSWQEIWSEGFTRRWQGWMAESANAHVFFEPATARAWVDTFSPLRDVQPRFLVATCGPGNLVFLPLVRTQSGWKDAWMRAIVPVGLPGFDYHDPILVGPADEGLWDGFWRGLEAELFSRWAGDFDLALVNGLRSCSLPGEPDQWLAGGLQRAERRRRTCHHVTRVATAAHDGRRASPRARRADTDPTLIATSVQKVRT